MKTISRVSVGDEPVAHVGDLDGRVGNLRPSGLRSATLIRAMTCSSLASASWTAMLDTRRGVWNAERGDTVGHVIGRRRLVA